MAEMMKISFCFLVVCMILAVIPNVNAKKPEPDRTLAAVVMSLCTAYQEGKKEHDMKCTRELTDGLKEESEKAKKFIETADSKAYCTGYENEGSLLRFDSACSIIAHLCDYMQLGELMLCPEVQPLVEKKSPVRRNSKKTMEMKKY